VIKQEAVAIDMIVARTDDTERDKERRNTMVLLSCRARAGFELLKYHDSNAALSEAAPKIVFVRKVLVQNLIQIKTRLTCPSLIDYPSSR